LDEGIMKVFGQLLLDPQFGRSGRSLYPQGGSIECRWAARGHPITESALLQALFQALAQQAPCMLLFSLSQKNLKYENKKGTAPCQSRPFLAE
jgi:hypothetical protein